MPFFLLIFDKQRSKAKSNNENTIPQARTVAAKVVCLKVIGSPSVEEQSVGDTSHRVSCLSKTPDDMICTKLKI